VAFGQLSKSLPHPKPLLGQWVQGQTDLSRRVSPSGQLARGAPIDQPIMRARSYQPELSLPQAVTGECN
jgi:hypothetical protein